MFQFNQKNSGKNKFMHTKKNQLNAFEEMKVSIKLKLAVLWLCFMFFYIYVDFFHLYMPGTIQNILEGKVFVFDISQMFLVAALVSISIPIVMAVLSVLLPAKVNRMTNIIMGTVYIAYSLINMIGEVWIHMILAVIIEIILLISIIYNAWNWPRLAT